jgi:HEAT repeat protein
VAHHALLLLRPVGGEAQVTVVVLGGGKPEQGEARRAAAASALGEGGFREALGVLLERKSNDPSPEVRQAASAALRRLQPR